MIRMTATMVSHGFHNVMAYFLKPTIVAINNIV